MYTQHQYSKYSVGAIKLLYFLIYVGMAAWSTQFYAFLERERALSGVQIGTLAAVQQINNLIVLPVWGMISDRYGKRKVFFDSFSIGIGFHPRFPIPWWILVLLCLHYILYGH